MLDVGARLSASVEALFAPARKHAPSGTPRPMMWCIEQVLGLGIGVELWLSRRGYRSYSPADADALREMLRSAQTFTGHSNLSRFDPDELRSEVDFAGSLGATALVVHPGTLALDEPEPPSADDLRSICRYALDRGVTLALENSGRSGIKPLVNALEMLGPDSGLGICVDTGHAHRSCARDGITPVDFLRELRDVIVEVHVNDNEGKADLHLPPGDGTIDWPSTISAVRELRPETVVCIELTAPDDPIEAVKRSREFLLHA